MSYGFYRRQDYYLSFTSSIIPPMLPFFYLSFTSEKKRSRASGNDKHRGETVLMSPPKLMVEHSFGEDGEGFLGFCYIYLLLKILVKNIYRETRKTCDICDKSRTGGV